MWSEIFFTFHRVTPLKMTGILQYLAVLAGIAACNPSKRLWWVVFEKFWGPTSQPASDSLVAWRSWLLVPRRHRWTLHENSHLEKETKHDTYRDPQRPEIHIQRSAKWVETPQKPANTVRMGAVRYTVCTSWFPVLRNSQMLSNSPKLMELT